MSGKRYPEEFKIAAVKMLLTSIWHQENLCPNG
ncbi:Uncharacterised protein [Escherichia coli]|nr:hypothetical protein Eco28_04738 [Escherichia coli]OMI48113.1 hypothetical protein Q676_22605 [Escherichia coli N40607]MBL0859366.1 hypothetical protein [Escherichia coli]CAK0659453.1 hypothetical protein FGAF163_40110 [Escherichia coli]CAK0733957.1 hypothetical protein FGAF95_02790 [Escherichia coli]